VLALSSAILAVVLAGPPVGSRVAAAREIEITTVTFIPLRFVELDGYRSFEKKVRERMAGTAKLKHLGAAEIIPPFEQPEAVSKGVVDITFTGATYPEAFVPVAPALDLSLVLPQEERKMGVYELWRKEYEQRLNVVYLGRFLYYPHHLWTKFEVKTLADFRGKTFRTSPAQRALVQAVGAGAIVLPPGEIYTALERGVVDGFGWPSVGVIDLGVARLIKHRIDPGFYRGAGVILMNRKKFMSLPPDARQQLEAIAAEVEAEMVEHFKTLTAREEAELKKVGVQFIKLAPQQASEYLDMAYDAMWKKVLTNAPELGARLKQLTYEGRPR
jgi:TRAP-type C4-dicarboxylate transport system substrate-binding protein